MNSAFTPQDWLENFRMSRETFLYLCDKLSSRIGRNETVMRKAVPMEQRVALTVWFLATGADYRTIGHLFGVLKSTVCVMTKQVCHSTVQLLLPEYIKVCTGTALKEVVDRFGNGHGFSQCAGVVDSTHIRIVSPQEYPVDYYNRKGWHSILMQGTVNHRGHFMDVYLDGQVSFMMLECSPIQACFTGAKARYYFRTRQNGLLIRKFHSWFLGIPHIPFTVANESFL